MRSVCFQKRKRVTIRRGLQVAEEMNCWGGWLCGNECVNEWDSWIWSLLHKLCRSTCSVRKGFASKFWPLTKLYHFRSLKLLRDLHIFHKRAIYWGKYKAKVSKGGKHILWDKELMAQHWCLLSSLTFTFWHIRPIAASSSFFPRHCKCNEMNVVWFVDNKTLREGFK